MTRGSVMPSIACINLLAAEDSSLMVLGEGGPFPPPRGITAHYVLILLFVPHRRLTSARASH